MRAREVVGNQFSTMDHISVDFNSIRASSADVEHDAAQRSDLRNTSIERLSWRQLSVSFGHKWAGNATPYFCLRDVDGVARSGMHYESPPSMLYLT